ncbi:MAG: hypothetical protein V4773_07450, partial [Verrucomicrobiota bacterium]
NDFGKFFKSAIDASGQFDNNRPFHGAEQLLVDSWLGYRLKWKKYALDFRLRAENVLNDDDPYLYRAVDDGTGNAYPTVRLKPAPRAFTFSTSVAF